MKRILITGATGLIGQSIVEKCLEQNMQVSFLTTNKSKLKKVDNYKGFYWNPKQFEIDIEAFKDVEVIINLAGSAITKRWTSSYKNNILNSRVESVNLLFSTIKKEKIPIQHFISASAIGYYPDSWTNYYTEDFDSKDDSFLINVIKEWETAADQMASLNIPVSKIRIGMVLSDHGGALPKIVKAIKYGLGAPFGSGEQWQSWIHIKDLTQLFIFVLENQLGGIYNAVAPNPVSNRDFTKTIARFLKRPLFLPNIPKVLMKIVLGEMHEILYESQRVSSKKIEDLGFQFKYYQITQAIEDLLIKKPLQ
jgi:hypothetical protein